MKVLLVSSNLHSQFPAVFPNGVGALSAYLQREGHQVQALHLARRRDYRKLPTLLNRFAPEIVGISVMTCETPIIEPVAATVKSWNPEVLVLVGGIHAIVAPETVLEVPLVDAVCGGEGELAFTQLLGRLEKCKDIHSTPNFIFRGPDGGLIRNDPVEFIADLETLPPPDRLVTDLQEVIDGNNGVLNVIFSRGCPWSCKFCCNRDLRAAGRGEYARLLPVAAAMEELAGLDRDYSFRHILLRDDTFTWNRTWALEFLEEYRRRFSYGFDLFSRVDCLDDTMMDALAAAGCENVFLGLDSGNDFIRNEVLHKEQSNEDLYKVVDYLKSVGIKPMISNIVGLPYETAEMFQDTVEINKHIHRDMVVFSPTCGACPKIWVFTPWPGSELYRTCEQEGWISYPPGSRKVYRESVLEMPQFPRADIERRFRTFRYEVYKDNFPVQALLFLVYDSRAFQAVFERVPLGLIGAVRQSLLTLMDSKRRRRLVRRVFSRR